MPKLHNQWEIRLLLYYDGLDVELLWHTSNIPAVFGFGNMCVYILICVIDICHMEHIYMFEICPIHDVINYTH